MGATPLDAAIALAPLVAVDVWGLARRGVRSMTAKTAVAAALVIAVGASKEMVVARVFGLAPTLDRYLVVSAVPLALLTVFSGSFQAAAVPELTTDAVSGGVSYHRFVGRFTIAIAIVTSAWAVATRLSGLNLGMARVGVMELVLLVVAIGAGAVAAGFAALNLARGRSVAVTLARAAISLSILGSVAALGTSDGRSLFVGLALGHVLMALVLVVTLRSQGRAPLAVVTSEVVRRIRSQSWIIAGGSAAMALTVPVDLYFAGRLTAGGPSAITFASLVPLAMATIGGTVIANVAFPNLAAAMSVAGTRGVASLSMVWARRSLLAGALGSAVVWAAGAPLVDLLFEGGSFEAADVALVTRIQAVAGLMLVPYSVGLVFVRALNAIRRNGALVVIGVLNLIVNAIGNILFGGWLGLPGIALATVVMYTVSAGAAWWAFRRATGDRQNGAGP